MKAWKKTSPELVAAFDKALPASSSVMPELSAWIERGHRYPAVGKTTTARKTATRRR